MDKVMAEWERLEQQGRHSGRKQCCTSYTVVEQGEGTICRDVVVLSLKQVSFFPTTCTELQNKSCQGPL